MTNFDSVDELVKRRNNVIRLDKQRVEIAAKYTKLLHDFGFGDVFVQPGAWYFFNGVQYFEVNRLQLFFWDKTFGYRIEISRGGRTEWNNTNKCITTGEFISICDKIIEFLSNPATLRECNIKEQLVLHLGKNEYEIVNVSRFSDENGAWLQVGKEGFFFTFRIERIDLQQDVLSPFVDDPEEDEPINDKFQKFLDDIAVKFDDYIRDTIQKYGWKCTVSTGLYEIELNRNGVCHKIRIHSGDNLSDPCTEEDVKTIIGNILSNEALLTAFQKDHSHLYMNPSKSNSFFVYKEWSKFEVLIDINTIFEFRELFVELSKSEWMIDFDQMDGHSFEQFCAKILRENGFESVRVTQGSGDQGIDIIAFKDGIKYGIQCKCYSSDIGNKAVQEVFAGKTFYECHVGVVLTNQHFTKAAVELAKKNGILLWDRKKLVELIKKAFAAEFVT